MTANKRMNSEITVADFVAECEVVINQMDPELAYNRADLYGFVKGCWPTSNTPADVACDFANAIKAKDVPM